MKSERISFGQLKNVLSAYSRVHSDLNEDSRSVVQAALDKLIQISAQYGILEILRLALESGGEINPKDDETMAPILRAVEHDNFDCVKYLHSNGAFLGVRDSYGWDAAHYAASGGSLRILKFLKKHKISLIEKARDGRTPAHLAHNLRTIKFLHDNGADLHALDHDKKNTAHRAAEYSSLDVFIYLANQGVNIIATDKDGRTPLDCAYASGNDEVIEYINSLASCTN